jgi:hypothetical protein
MHALLACSHIASSTVWVWLPRAMLMHHCSRHTSLMHACTNPSVTHVLMVACMW